MEFIMEPLFCEDMQKENMLNAYFQKALSMLADIDIVPERIDSISINSTATTFWGCARINRRENTRRVEISYRLVNNAWKEERLNVMYGFDNKPLMEVILHECLHCVDDCQDHGGKWKSLAEKVNSAYGLSISRCASHEHLNVAFKDEDYKYVCECSNCHTKLGYNRMTKFIKHPEWYACATCKEAGVKTKFIRIK